MNEFTLNELESKVIEQSIHENEFDLHDHECAETFAFLNVP